MLLMQLIQYMIFGAIIINKGDKKVIGSICAKWGEYKKIIIILNLILKNIFNYITLV